MSIRFSMFLVFYCRDLNTRRPLTRLPVATLQLVRAIARALVCCLGHGRLDLFFFPSYRFDRRAFVRDARCLVRHLISAAVCPLLGPSLLL